MNISNVQRLQNPPYQNADQKGPFIVSATDDTPGDAQKSIQRFVYEVSLWHDGTWHMDPNEEGAPAQIITTLYYDPPFRVRAFKLWFGATTLFARIVYNTPWAFHVVSRWACGSTHPGEISRLYLGDNSMEQGTPDAPFEISLLG